MKVIAKESYLRTNITYARFLQRVEHSLLCRALY